MNEKSVDRSEPISYIHFVCWSPISECVLIPTKNFRSMVRSQHSDVHQMTGKKISFGGNA